MIWLYLLSWKCDRWLHAVNETLFLTRRESSDREIICSSRDHDFGRNFERLFTQQDSHLKDSTSHHRVITYLFGGLKCVIRFEVDAYCDSNENSQTIQVSSTSHDIMSGPFRNLSLSKTKNHLSTRVTHCEHVIPCAATVEVKSRSKKTKLQQAMPQFWFSRTPRLFCGFHNDGMFNKIDKFDCTSQFQEWEDKHQTSLRKMTQLIDDLRRITRNAANRSCVVLWEWNRPANFTNSLLSSKSVNSAKSHHCTVLKQLIRTELMTKLINLFQRVIENVENCRSLLRPLAPLVTTSTKLKAISSGSIEVFVAIR